MERNAYQKLIPNLNFLTSGNNMNLLYIWIHVLNEFIYSMLGSWSQISSSLHLFHYTPLHSPLHSSLHSVCNTYVGALPLCTSWERRQSKFATTLLRYMCVIFSLSAQVSTKLIILCSNLTVRQNCQHTKLLSLINVLHWCTVIYKNTQEKVAIPQ